MFKIGNSPEGVQPQNEENKNQLTEDLSAASRGISGTRAVPETYLLARELKDGTLSGYVGHGTTVTGDIGFKGMLRVDGTVGGTLTSDGGTMIVGDGGQVNADVKVAVALVRGTVHGDITATQRIELGRTARVHGNMTTASLSIDQGAVFDGACRMSGAIPAEKAAPAKLGEVKRADNGADYGALAASLNKAVNDDTRERKPVSVAPEVSK